MKTQAKLATTAICSLPLVNRGREAAVVAIISGAWVDRKAHTSMIPKFVAVVNRLLPTLNTQYGNRR